MAWPAFAYSIEDDREAQRTYSFVLTYVVYVCCWLALALGLLAPWIVRLITTEPFYPAQNVVAPLAFGVAAFGAYVVVQIGTGRARQTRSNWLVSGAAAIVNLTLNFALIPSYGRMGAAIATVVAYTLLFLGMAWRAQRVFPVPYQWRRVATLAVAAVGLTAARQAPRRPARSGSRADGGVPARARPARLLPAGRAAAVTPSPAYPGPMSLVAAILLASDVAAHHRLAGRAWDSRARRSTRSAAHPRRGRCRDAAQHARS